MQKLFWSLRSALFVLWLIATVIPWENSRTSSAR